MHNDLADRALYAVAILCFPFLMWVAAEESLEGVEVSSAPVTIEEPVDPYAEARAVLVKHHPAVPREVIDEILREAVAAAERTGVPAALLIGIARAESSLRPTVKSGHGAKGLMQIVPKWHRDTLARHGGNPYEISTALNAGADIIAAYLERCGSNTRCALKRYNGSLNHPHGDVYVAKVTRYSRDVADHL